MRNARRGPGAPNPLPLRVAEDSTAIGVCYAGYGPDGTVWVCLAVELADAFLAVYRGQPDGDDVDAALSMLAGMGMRPALDPLDPPQPDAITWRVQLPRPGGGGGIYGRIPPGHPGGPGRMPLLEPLPPIPPGWPNMVAARGGQCGLHVAARAGLAAVMPPTPTVQPTGLSEAMTAAGRAGRLMATFAAVTT